MVFSSNGAGRRPAPPLVKPTVQKTSPSILNTPTINSYLALNRQGMLQRVKQTSSCTSCGK